MKSLIGTRRALIALFAVLMTAVLTACSMSSRSADVAAAGGEGGDAGPRAADVVLQLSQTDGATGVDPSAPIVVTAEHGTLTDVKLTNAAGVVVSGELSAAKDRWTSSEPLGYGKTYALDVTGTGDSGAKQQRASFTTVSPRTLTKAYIIGAGETVGVGQPVAIKFDEPITDRRAAQNSITITTSPQVEGAFYWLSNQELRWRPAAYWAPGTRVDVKVEVYGKNLGNGMYGQENSVGGFTIGDKVVATADDNTKQITIERNGVVERSMPTSMGKVGHETPNGTYIIADQHNHIVMDSSTYGVPVNSAEGYRTDVQYATRMSYSGIFVHAAPWSVYAQGNSNTSHGCLNVSTSDAQWFMQNTKRGDIVIVRNTSGGTISGVDGLGDWNIPWETWKAGNA